MYIRKVQIVCVCSNETKDTYHTKNVINIRIGNYVCHFQCYNFRKMYVKEDTQETTKKN